MFRHVKEALYIFHVAVSHHRQLDAPTYDFADEVHFKQLIREKLAGNPEEIPRCKSKASVLMELAHEMRLIKEEIANSKAGQLVSKKNPVFRILSLKLSTTCSIESMLCPYLLLLGSNNHPLVMALCDL